MSVRTNASNEGLKRTAAPTPIAFTIAGHVMKRGTGDPDWSCIAGLNSSGGSAWAILYERVAGSSLVRIHNSNGDASLGVTLALDTWYYFAIGCNGTGAGSLTGWIITTTGTVYTASVPGTNFTPVEMFLLNNSIWGEWTNGLIADPMVWSTKLTTAELQAQRVASNPVSQIGSIYNWAHLKLHTDLADYSGNSRPWTSMGGTLSTESDPPGLWVDTGNIDLDLVTYTSTVNDITILESEIISLDLVVYTSTINDIIILENELLVLDLVSYTSYIYDLIMLENELLVLDLVTYSSIYSDIVVIESELVLLDLVAYSSVFNDINVIESELLPLDLVVYSSIFNDLTVTEYEIINLDLVIYYNAFNDILLYENDIISLDLVLYNNIFNDITITETELDFLDLVVYNNIFNDIFITETDLLELDLVLYSTVVNDIEISETELIILDLVLYSSTFYDISFDSFMNEYHITMSRCYSILEEQRIIPIEYEERIVSIPHEDRTILIF